MTTKLVKLASDDDHITKSGLSDGRRAKLLPSVVEIVYNCHCSGGYLGNVGWKLESHRERFVNPFYEYLA